MNNEPPVVPMPWETTVVTTTDRRTRVLTDKRIFKRHDGLIVLISGAALGIVSRLGDGLPPALVWLVNIGGPWLAVAFAMGARGRTPRGGAIQGGITLVSAVIGYYGWMHVVEHEANLAYLRHIAAYWLAVAVAGGALFGVAGAVWRRREGWPRVGAVALLSAALAGESALVLLRALGSPDPGQKVVMGIELAVALGLPWALLRERRATIHALLLTISGTVVAAAAAAGIMIGLRTLT